MKRDNVNYNHIVIEGIDGCGKSTVVNYIKESYQPFGLDKKVITDCSPYNEEVTKVIRKLLKNEYKLNKKILHKELLSLFMLDNHIHSNEVEEKIKSSNSNVIISDRYIASTLAYQSLNASMWKIKKIIKEYKDIKYPGLIIFLDLPVTFAASRIDKRGEEKEIFEKVETLSKIERNYYDAFSIINKLSNHKSTIIKVRIGLTENPLEVKEKVTKLIYEYLQVGGQYLKLKYLGNEQNLDETYVTIL